MSNQESVVEETRDVEEVSQSTSTESSADVAEAEEAPQSSPSSEESTTTQSEDATETPSSEESTPSTTTEESPADIHNLKVGQHIVGKVKNITNFGAFVDIGLPQDGLVHISKLSRRKVDKVSDVVSDGQEVDVWVKKVDKKRGRISLTMIKPVTLKLKNIKEGAELEGTVTRLEPYGAFVDIGSNRDGLVHISQITHDYIKSPEEALAVGDKVNVKVLKVNRKKRQVDLSMKALTAPPSPVEEVKQVKEQKAAPEAEPAGESDSVPTAMALAYAAFQDENQSDQELGDKDSEWSKDKSKKKQEMDDIIARTLAAREN